MPEAQKLQEIRSPSKPLVPSPLTQYTKRIPADLEKTENKFSAEEIDRIGEKEQRSPKTFRALYDFEGDANYKEISFEEGELLSVIKENISEGWHLAEKNSIQGLIPIRYVEEFLLNEEPDKFSAEDLNSVASNNRNSIFGLKQLNRFSWFVSTGVEEFILGIDDTPTKDPLPEKTTEETTKKDEVERHFIEDGPYWKQKTDMFTVFVHSPENKTNSLTQQEYTIFQVTSSFSEGAEITVGRRYSQFEWLLERLQAKFRALVLPPLPEKQFSGRFSDEFIEKRRRHLERFMNRLARHPIVRYSEIFMHFLSSQTETEWSKGDKKFITERNCNGFAFFQKVFHPEFNVDEDGDKELVEKFYNHLKSVDKLLPSCLEGVQGFRDHENEAGQQYRKFSYMLLRLISDPNENSPDCLNEENAWCFKDECEDCLKLTKAIQEMAEHMQSIANTYDEYTSNQFTNSVDLLKEYLNISYSCAPLIEMHSGALKKYQEVSEKENSEDSVDIESVRSRCDTVFNVALAEINRIHDEKIQDFHTQSIDFLEQQIEFHQKVIDDLKNARDCLLDPKYSEYSKSPRQFSHYKLEEQTPKPISRPASVTSVSSVMGGVVDGVNSFLKSRARTSIARSSVLGDWIGWKSSGLAKPVTSPTESEKI